MSVYRIALERRLLRKAVRGVFVLLSLVLTTVKPEYLRIPGDRNHRLRARTSSK